MDLLRKANGVKNSSETSFSFKSALEAEILVIVGSLETSTWPKFGFLATSTWPELSFLETSTWPKFGWLQKSTWPLCSDWYQQADSVDVCDQLNNFCRILFTTPTIWTIIQVWGLCYLPAGAVRGPEGGGNLLADAELRHQGLKLHPCHSRLENEVCSPRALPICDVEKVW